MQTRLAILVWALAIGPDGPSLFAQGVDSPSLRYGSPYREIRTWHEQRLALERTTSQRFDDARHMLGARYGQRGLNSLFRGLAGPGSVDFSIPGIDVNLRLTTSDNRNVARGATRTHLYATRIHHDSRFQLLAVNQPTRTPLGMTDKDIVYRHRGTSTRGRIEVKSLSPHSQRRNLTDLKRQIDKMAYSWRATGESQAFVNRHGIIPELKTHLRGKGIPSYENVATGRQSLRVRGTQSIDQVLNDLDRRATAIGRTRMLRSGAGTGLGLFLLARGSRDVYEEWRALRETESTRQGSLNRLGQHASIGVAGLGLSVSSFADRGASLNSSTRGARWLSRIGKWGGRIVPVASLAAAYFTYRSYRNGEISRREFVTMRNSLAGGAIGGLGGAWAGAKAGAIAGAWFGPWGAGIGGFIGSIAGGFAGGYAGSSLAEYGTNSQFQFEQEQDRRAFEEFVYGFYSANTP